MIAFVSDIHGNLEALSAVLERIGPDGDVMCLGDIVGYGPDPNDCVALVRARATATVLGNHDVAAVDGHGLGYFNDYARRALEWTQTVLAPDHVAWLDGLSYELRMPDFLLVHGAPVDYFTYILDTAAAERAFASTDAPLVFVGHTHVAGYFSLSPDGVLGHALFPRGGRLELEPGTRYIINVGSVGQPRDANPDACFVKYDPVAKSVVWERVAYEFARTQAKMGAAHLPDALVQRLSRGR